MKNILISTLLLFSLSAAAQTPPTFTKINSKYMWLGGGFDSVIVIPRYSSIPSGVRVGIPNIAGQLAMDTVNNAVYYYSSSTWWPLLRSLSAVPPISVSGSTVSTLMNTNRLIGRYTGSSGVMQEIKLGPGLSFSNDSLLVTGTQTLTFDEFSGSFRGTLSGTPNTFRIIPGTGITVTSGGTTNDGTATIAATDASTTNELQTIAVSGTTTGITTLSNSGGSMTIAGAGINTVGVAGSTITITGTEVDGSTTNELQTLAGSGTTSPTVTLSNGGGAFSVTGAGIAVASRSGLDITITATEVDGSTSNELQTISTSGTTTPTVTLSNGGGSFSITGAGIAALSRSGDAFTVTATEVDGSTSNELQTIAVTGTTTGITTLSNGGGSMTIAGAGINTVGVAGSTITVTATEVDGSTSNELQTIANTSDGTSHTVTLSDSGGSVQLIEGTGITLTTGGSGSAGTVTIASTALEYEVVNGLHLTSPDSIKLGGYLIENTEINGDEGAYDMSFVAIGDFSVDAINIALTAGAGGAISLGGKIYYTTDISPTTIGANENNYSPTDFSSASVLRLTSDASRNITGLAGGADGRTLKIFNIGSNDIVLKDQDANSTAANRFELYGDKTIKGGDGIDLWYDATTQRWRALDITQRFSTADVGGNTELSLLGSGGTTFTIIPGSGISIATGGTSDDGTVTISADLSGVVTDVTASGLLTSSGGTTPDISSSVAQARLVGRGGSSGTGAFEAITVGGILSFSGTTLNATEVDGSTSNELQTLSGSGTSSPTITLSDGGGAFSITGAGIAVASRSGTDITITATEVDGSTSNELQTLDNTSDATSHTQTLSDGGGSTQFIEGTGITLTTGGTGSAGTVTIAVSQTLASGTYTPTLTGAENIGSATAYECQYLRVGNVVTVSGQVDLTWSAASTFTRLGVSLPIASSLSATNQLGGAANSQGDIQNGYLAIRADAGNDRAEIHGYSPSSGEGYTYYFTFTYQIL